VSAEGQLIYINFFHQSNSIQLLVSSVIDSSHTRFAAWRSGGFPCLPADWGAQNCQYTTKVDAW